MPKACTVFAKTQDLAIDVDRTLDLLGASSMER
jgi:hypothetical protein